METLWQFLLDNIYTIIGVILGSGFIGVGAYAFVGKLASKGSVIFTELGEAFTSGGDWLAALDKDIKDDGKLDAREIKDLLMSGKQVVKEFKDVIVTIKPKKKNG